MEEAPDLLDCVLHDVEIKKNLWAESFSEGILVISNGIECMGKKLYDTLITDAIRKKSFDECRLLKKLRHPNIVQFLGVHVLPSTDALVLVTELLPYDLNFLLETHYNLLSTPSKLSILHDIARGLFYLHSQDPRIVHGDISPSCIRLNSLTAKITNFEAAVGIGVELENRSSRDSGHGPYKAPEAYMSDNTPNPSSAEDIFSFGVVALQTVTGLFPGGMLAAVFFDENRVLHARTEIERRYQHLDEAEEVGIIIEEWEL